MTTTADERARVQALHDLADPTVAQSEEIERIVAQVAEVAGVSMAALNLLDTEHQYSIATVNCEVDPVPRTDAMCDVTLREGAFVLVPDARADPRFADSPWVDGRCGQVRFYASVPLITRDQHVIGTLCAFDVEPHALSPSQVDRMQALAAQVISTFEAQRAARTTQGG